MSSEDVNDLAGVIADISEEEVEDQEIDPGSEGAKSLMGTILMPLILIGLVCGVMLFIFLSFF
ncbi:hypothetical protein [Gluconobacter wancherniae]|uniref:Uncharacterized protein n=1 Tax=Gluconobacter wancherniae NBRC 103581 TaxID=656744 RepID=A0A511B561_9PROT|nr:hypothetical protein [Gluconobacter wancherniae]MBF0853120.1 hypothetical protein [Gluconobacter wancherniae]MBS1061535.1 hypothetical protein [Gluconobacter wancherniae]MBS1093699.1 hypothetical protein [Gluconobacter wancherniae]GBD56162.1 hypothetical protein NBRC103581_00735 [Gluconobacter wancherniae NBRC 103581]GEK92937.1 hypothetical protein GWA01_07070 [Gluconobacter wancherniae NBRC 103581]